MSVTSRSSLEADIIIANAPDPVFVSDLEGKILQANEAVSQLLDFRPDELLEQSLSRFISPEERREFTATLQEVMRGGQFRKDIVNLRRPIVKVILMAVNAYALTDIEGSAICGK